MAKRRWAIVGSGEVAGKFIIGLKSTPGAEVALVASRTEARAQAFAAPFGVARAVGGYAEAAAQDFDIAYIATPPSEHLAHARLFLAAGKAVVMEKPLAAGLADGQAIAQAAAGRFCMEGMWTRFLPAMALARRLIREGRIGVPLSLHASFGTANVTDPDESLFRPDLGGGSLAHRGVYPIALALDLLGPAAVAGARLTLGRTGVDEEATALLAHEGGAVSTLYTSTRATGDNGLVLLGSEGALRFAGPIYRPFGIELTARPARRRGTNAWGRAAQLKEGPVAQGLRQALDPVMRLASRRKVIAAPYVGNGYTHEAQAAMEALDQGLTEHPLCPLSDSLAVLKIVDDIRAAAGTPGPDERATA